MEQRPKPITYSYILIYTLRAVIPECNRFAQSRDTPPVRTETTIRQVSKAYFGISFLWPQSIISMFFSSNEFGLFLARTYFYYFLGWWLQITMCVLYVLSNLFYWNALYLQHYLFKLYRRKKTVDVRIARVITPRVCVELVFTSCSRENCKQSPVW